MCYFSSILFLPQIWESVQHGQNIRHLQTVIMLHWKQKEIRIQSIESSCCSMLLPIFSSDLTPRSISTLCCVSGSSNTHRKLELSFETTYW